MTACIVGWAHGKFGKREGLDLEALIKEVAVQAIADAGVAPGDVDAIHVGHFGGGFVKQDFPASLVMQADDGLRLGGVAAGPEVFLARCGAVAQAQGLQAPLQFARHGRCRV